MAKMSEQERILLRTPNRTLDLRGWIFAAVTMLAVWVVGVLLPLRWSVLLSILGIAASTVGLVISARAIRAGKRDPLFSIWLGGGLVEYFLYDEGDTYTLKEHKGAFGKPFYARG